jgi:hypothetical protein
MRRRPTAKLAPPGLGPTAQRHEAPAPESSRIFTTLPPPIIYTPPIKATEKSHKKTTKNLVRFFQFFRGSNSLSCSIASSHGLGERRRPRGGGHPAAAAGVGGRALCGIAAGRRPRPGGGAALHPGQRRGPVLGRGRQRRAAGVEGSDRRAEGGEGRGGRGRGPAGRLRDLPGQRGGRREGDAVRAPLPRGVPGALAGRARQLPHLPPRAAASEGGRRGGGGRRGEAQAEDRGRGELHGARRPAGGGAAAAGAGERGAVDH